MTAHKLEYIVNKPYQWLCTNGKYYPVRIVRHIDKYFLLDTTEGELYSMRIESIEELINSKKLIPSMVYLLNREDDKYPNKLDTIISIDYFKAVEKQRIMYKYALCLYRSIN